MTESNARRLDWQMACQGKSCFPSRRLAQQTIDRRRRTGDKRLPLQPYLCKDCHKWHVGNRK